MVTKVWVHSMELLSKGIASCISKTHFFFSSQIYPVEGRIHLIFSAGKVAEDRDYQSLHEGCKTQE